MLTKEKKKRKKERNKLPMAAAHSPTCAASTVLVFFSVHAEISTLKSQEEVTLAATSTSSAPKIYWKEDHQSFIVQLRSCSAILDLFKDLISYMPHCNSAPALLLKVESDPLCI